MAEAGHPARVRLSPNMRLQWEKAQGAHVLLYPEGVVQLNESAAVILELCDGSRTADQVIGELAQRFDAPGLAEDISDFLVTARSHGWIVDA